MQKLIAQAETDIAAGRLIDHEDFYAKMAPLLDGYEKNLLIGWSDAAKLDPLRIINYIELFHSESE